MQETSQTEFKFEKVIKRKCDRLFIKWKGYNSSFNKWTEMKDVV